MVLLPVPFLLVTSDRASANRRACCCCLLLSVDILILSDGGNDLVKTQTPLMGIERRPEVHIVGAAEGVPLCGTFCGVGDIPAAVALARQADVAILFVGLHSTQGAQSQATNASTDVPGQNNGPGMEREGYDRTNLTLPPGQEELIKSVSATGVKVAVVLINSGGVACEGWLSSVSALLEAYYPGEMGGDAIASVLFGDVSPSGRLTTTVYYADFIHQRNITDMVCVRACTAPPCVIMTPNAHAVACVHFAHTTYL